MKHTTFPPSRLATPHRPRLVPCVWICATRNRRSQRAGASRHNSAHLRAASINEPDQLVGHELVPASPLDLEASDPGLAVAGGRVDTPSAMVQCRVAVRASVSDGAFRCRIPPRRSEPTVERPGGVRRRRADRVMRDRIVAPRRRLPRHCGPGASSTAGGEQQRRRSHLPFRRRRRGGGGVALAQLGERGEERGRDGRGGEQQRRLDERRRRRSRRRRRPARRRAAGRLGERGGVLGEVGREGGRLCREEELHHLGGHLLRVALLLLVRPARVDDREGRRRERRARTGVSGRLAVLVLRHHHQPVVQHTALVGDGLLGACETRVQGRVTDTSGGAVSAQAVLRRQRCPSASSRRAPR